MRLTIAIPTYNRNQTLLKYIKGLLPQLTPECKLLIFDNLSDTPVAETLQESLAQFPQINCEIVRNRANIGGNANIMRCLEMSETEWVWILGDDDQVMPDAIDIILKYIDAYPACLLLNFSHDGVRKQSFMTKGLEQMVAEFDPSADLPWISSNVYNRARLAVNLKYGYQYTYSMLPHVVTLLVSIKEDDVCVFSIDQIVDGQSRDTPVEEQWSLISMALGFPTLLDLPFKPKVREALLNKLLLTNQGDGINRVLHHMVYELLLMSVKGNDRETALYLYDQIWSRRYYFDTTIKRNAELRFYRMLLRFPALTRLGWRIVKRKEIGAEREVTDRFRR